MNNTARQTGEVIGIAVYGAIAGEPSNASRFVAGLQVTGFMTSGLFLARALASLFLIPRKPSYAPTSGGWPRERAQSKEIGPLKHGYIEG